MKIGIPKEIKNHEYRVGMTPAGVALLCERGHEVFVENNAGHRLGFSNEQYQHSGARIVETAKEVYLNEMVVKVKEPQNSEFPLMHSGQMLFCYLHLAPDPDQTRELLARDVIAIAYETVTERDKLPLLVPMSEVAGRLSVQAGANALQMASGGNGVLLGGVPGVKPARVVVLGGGVVGTQASRMALGLGADVTILDNNLTRLRELDDLYGPVLKTCYADPVSLEEQVTSADLVIGAVLIAGKHAPRLITRDMVRKMKPGSVLVDVAIDQGGCAETSRATTHSDPTYIVDDVVHYCVANMPGACARTSTSALTNATLPYVLLLAEKGCKKALLDNPGFARGLNIYHGRVTNRSVADDLKYPYIPAIEVLAASAQREATVLM